MKNPTNLRFFLALGNQKVIAVHQQDELQIYTSATSTRSPNQVSTERLAAVLHTK